MTIILELLQGFGLTLLLFAITLVMAIPLGLLISFCSMSRFRVVRAISRGFVWIIRGTPLLLQILAISFVPSFIFGIPNKTIYVSLGITLSTLNFIFVAVAFVINYACYFSEIFRGGIESISKGQYEAGQVLGMTKRQIFFNVVLLQVVKRIMAPMSNEIITLVKDTSLARTLAVAELYFVAAEAVNIHVSLLPLVYAGAFYLIFNGVLTILFGKIEKKLSYFRS